MLSIFSNYTIYKFFQTLFSLNFLSQPINNFAKFRSGSCEGSSPTSIGPNLIAALASGTDTNSIGTWKLIKGKVTQTIEDIKSSKISNQTITAKGDTPHEPDSDWETATIHSSISDELSLDQELKQLQKADSDSDADYELLYETGIGGAGDSYECSRLRRGLTNTKSKVKSKAATNHLHHQHKPQPPHSLSSSPTPTTQSGGSTTKASVKIMKTDSGPSRDGSNVSAASIGSSSVRSRKKTNSGDLQPPTAASSDASVSNSTCCYKLERKVGNISPCCAPQEIESGVEMVEGMMLNRSAMARKSVKKIALDLPLDADATKPSRMTMSNFSVSLKESREQVHSFLMLCLNILRQSAHLLPYYTILALLFIMWLPMPEFLRGVLACLLATALLESLWSVGLIIVEQKLLTASPEKSKFIMPVYKNTEIFEVPAVEEHNTVRTYAGWMNEINSYDPNDFHISMTDSVYCKLDGTVLRVSNTLARVPKRAMWNEVPIDRSTIQFTQHRTYNLLGCRIELLPVGLARKRYFNRKYPIQLIIKNPCEVKTVDNPDQDARTTTKSLPSKLNTTGSNKKINDEDKFFDVLDSNNSIGANATNASSDLRPESSNTVKQDFAATIMNADLQTLQQARNYETEFADISMPCGDETRLILFSRGDREKEDWYRRFVAASTGDVDDQELHLPNTRFVDDIDLQEAAVKAALLLTNHNSTQEKASTRSTSSITANQTTRTTDKSNAGTPEIEAANDGDDEEKEEYEVVPEDTFEGLVISSCAGRNPRDYISFMAMYQARRAKRQEDELWKGINQSLFLGPAGSVVWFNVLAGRFIYSMLNNCKIQAKIQHIFQKKLSSIKLPNFMEDVIITQINMGDTPPLIHRISQAMLDERGTWVDADITYEGVLNFTVTTKLNLLRLRRQVTPRTDANIVVPAPEDLASSSSFSLRDEQLAEVLSDSAIFDSDAESSGSSSSDSEGVDLETGSIPSSTATTTSAADVRSSDTNAAQSQQQQQRKKPHKIFKIVDRFAESNFFQYAAELPYIKRAMENMSANITLRLEVKGVVGRVTINMPPPPSDRIWFGFRGPPRLWIQAKPAFGDKSVDWSFLTNVIESKVCEHVNKNLVFPNMVDITIDFLGTPEKEESNTT